MDANGMLFDECSSPLRALAYNKVHLLLSPLSGGPGRHAIMWRNMSAPSVMHDAAEALGFRVEADVIEECDVWHATDVEAVYPCLLEVVDDGEWDRDTFLATFR